MFAFAGTFDLHADRAQQTARCEAMEQALLSPAEEADTYASGPLGLALRGPWTVKETPDAVLVFDGRLTPGDGAETALAAWRRWGTDCPAHLQGSFVFALYDKAGGRLLLARDAMGSRTLFYTLAGAELVFGVDLAAVLAHPAVEPVLGAAGAARLVLLGPGKVPGETPLEGVKELLPGQCVLYDGKELTAARYWQLRDEPWQGSFEEAAQQVRELVTERVRQAAQDGPCAFLSGGLDSSVVCAAAGVEALATFSVDYRDNAAYFQAGGFQPGSDGEFVAVMREFLHSDHHPVVLDTPELAGALEEAMAARGLPGMADVDASLLLLCRAARAAGFSAALSGECSDEIFGGYPWFRRETLDGFPWARNTAQRAAFLRETVLSAADAEDYVNQEFERVLAEIDLLPDTQGQERLTKQLTALNLSGFGQTLLARNDAMGRAAGVELRAPFCDAELAQLLYNLPWEWKCRDGQEKALLRHAFRDALPPAVLERKKSPYPKTWNPSYRREAARLLRQELEGDCPLYDFLRPEALQALLAEDRSLPWYGQLMTTPQTIAYFYQMSRWLKRFSVRVAV